MSESQKRDILTKEHKEIENQQEDESPEIHSTNNLPEQSKENTITDIEPLPQEEITVKDIPHKNTEKNNRNKTCIFSNISRYIFK